MILKNHIIVYVSFLPWSFFEQISPGLDKKNEVIFICPNTTPISLFKSLIQKSDRKRIGESVRGLLKKRPLINFPLIGILPFQRFSIIRKLNQHLFWQLLKLFIKIVNRNKKPILWLTHPNFHYLAGCLNEKISVYDCIDHFCEPNPKEEERMRSKEGILVEKVDVVFINSPSLLQGLKRIYGKKIFITPAGFPLDDFLNRKKFVEPKNYKDIPRPIIGFAGAISYRLDFNLLLNLVGRNPHLSFLFVGPMSKSKFFGSDMDRKTGFVANWNKLREYKNFYYFGTKTREELAHYVAFFNVGIIPYNISYDFNLNSNPIKAYEYLALGKFVVSTPIKALLRWKNYIYFAEDYNQFSRKIKIALKKRASSHLTRKMRLIASQNSVVAKRKMIERVFKEKRWLK
jgi:hypothetical protein